MTYIPIYCQLPESKLPVAAMICDDGRADDKGWRRLDGDDALQGGDQGGPFIDFLGEDDI